MNYAIIKVHSKQYIVKEGDKILIDYIKTAKNDANIEFKSILYVTYNNESICGNPYIKQFKINAIVINQCVKAKKVRVFKKKRRKGYHKTIGHRQKYTEIKIDKIIKHKD